MHHKRTAASACREVLKELTKLTRLIHDEEVLDSIHENLQQLHKYVAEAVLNQNGLLLEPTNRKRTTASVQECGRLPLPKKTKSNRSGSKSPKKRKCSTNKKIPSEMQPQLEVNILEEHVRFDDNCTYADMLSLP